MLPYRQRATAHNPKGTDNAEDTLDEPGNGNIGCNQPLKHDVHSVDAIADVTCGNCCKAYHRFKAQIEVAPANDDTVEAYPAVKHFVMEIGAKPVCRIGATIVSTTPEADVSNDAVTENPGEETCEACTRWIAIAEADSIKAAKEENAAIREAAGVKPKGKKTVARILDSGKRWPMDCGHVKFQKSARGYAAYRIHESKDGKPVCTDIGIVIHAGPRKEWYFEAADTDLGRLVSDGMKSEYFSHHDARYDIAAVTPPSA